MLLNLNFKFIKKKLETLKYHRQLFNLSMIPSIKNNN